MSVAGRALVDRRAVGMALSRKGEKSRTGGRKLRSTRTKAGTRVPQERGSITRLQQQLEARTRQLTEAQRHADDARSQLAEARKYLSEAREQEIATSEVLRVISSSPGDLKPVFQTMLANATRLCEAKFGSLFLRERDGFRNVCNIAEPSGYTEWYRQEPMVVLREYHPQIPLARIARNKAVLHVPDLATEQAYIERDPRMVALVESASARSLLAVRMTTSLGPRWWQIAICLHYGQGQLPAE